MLQHSQIIGSLLERARRRQVAQLVLEQSGLALGVAFAGSILLLLVGTQILDWYWLALLFAGAFMFGLWRTLRAVPSSYSLAQQIDSRLGSHDAISTAHNYEAMERPAREDVRLAQREQAEQFARSVNIAETFPFFLPKTLYATAGVALVALGMFALRYGVTHSLDLRPSLVQIAFDNFFQPDGKAPGKKSALRKKFEEEMQKLGFNVNSQDTEASDPSRVADTTMSNAETDVNSPGEADSSSKMKASNVPSDQPSGDSPGDPKADKSASSTNDGSNAEQPADGNDGQPQNGNQKATKDNKQSNGENSSLMDKMKDAMANLMDKLKASSKQDGKQSAQNSQQNQKGQQGQGEKGQQAGKQQSNGGQAQDQQSDQQSQGDPSQSAQGKSGDKSAEKSASDAKSGVGKQDGDKSNREAEQLAAMGKISEILGKRAKDMTGEMMVEVSNGKQQLKTQYSSKSAAHAGVGGEIQRDEVPLEYHEFVQQYFEQIRKLPGQNKKAAEPAPAAAPVPAKRTE